MYVTRPLPPGRVPHDIPQFIDPAPFGVSPHFAPRGTPDPAEVQGPPDPIATLRDELRAFEREAERVLWSRRSENPERGIAGVRTLRRLAVIIAELQTIAPAIAPRALKLHPLKPVPAGVMLTLVDLLPIIRPALILAHHLIARRKRSEALLPSPSGERAG